MRWWGGVGGGNGRGDNRDGRDDNRGNRVGEVGCGGDCRDFGSDSGKSRGQMVEVTVEMKKVV